MAILVKYVVVSEGREDMIFSTRKEAEVHDKMIEIAEQLSAFLAAAALPIPDASLEALTWFMAQHRVDIGSILQGKKLPTPTVQAPPVPEPQDTQAEAPSVVSQDTKTETPTAAPKRSKSSQSALPSPPHVAA